MKKYPTKYIWIILVSGVLFAATASIVINRILAISKNVIILSLQDYTGQKVSIGKLFFIPPNNIIAKDISFRKNSKPHREIFFIPKLSLKFSLWHIAVHKRRFVFSNVSVYAPSAELDVILAYLKDKFSGIMELLNRLPKMNFKLQIKKARFDFKKETQAKPLIANIVFTIKNNSFYGTGSFWTDTPDNPFQYNFKGAAGQNGFTLENIELRKEGRLALQLWGINEQGISRFNGFAFMNIFAEENLPAPYVSFMERFQLFLDKWKKPFPRKYSSKFTLPKFLFPRTVGLAGWDLNISNLDCQLRLAFPKLYFKHLKFFLNNIPVSIEGNMSLDEPITLDLVSSLFFVHTQNTFLGSLKKIELATTGAFVDDSFNCKGFLNIDFSEPTQESGLLKKITVDFDDLDCQLDKFVSLKASLKKGVLCLMSPRAAHTLVFTDAEAFFPYFNKKISFFKFGGSLYDGTLQGSGRIDKTGQPPKISSQTTIKNISAEKLKDFLEHFSKVHASLDAQTLFSNYPELILQGKISMKNGYVENFIFLKWLSGLFALPEIQKIDFDDLSTDFLIDKNGQDLYDMALRSENLNLNGYFGVDRNEYVSSLLSLEFKRTLVEQSKKLRPLLEVLDKDTQVLSFDFKLSGNLHAMNFQWLQNDFKRKLKESVPGYVQRKIEEKIEERISSISAPQ